MKLYIAYKYSNNKDKEKLKNDLDTLSEKVKLLGFDTFILGRDIKKWQHVKFGYIKQIPVIYKNMAKCEAVLIFANSRELSIGMLFELAVSKLLFKKTILLYQDYDASILKKIVNRNFNIGSFEDITSEMLE